MTLEQANQLIAEIWNLKMEFVRLMDAQAVQNQQVIELQQQTVNYLNQLHGIGIGIGALIGVIVGVMCAKIWAVTFRI